MAFGFFRKSEAPDKIFTNGKIYTADTDVPWVEAVAVKKGKISALGDAEVIMELEGKKTEIVDLEGGYMFPGFIDIYGQPVLKAFKGEYFKLSEDDDLEAVEKKLSKIVSKNKDKAALLAVGFDEAILQGKEQEEQIKILDAICKDRPLMALSASGLMLWANSVAVAMVHEVAAAENRTYIPISLFFGVTTPIDFENIEKSVVKIAENYCKQGVTTVMNCGGIEYFDSAYQDVLIAMSASNMVKQRFLGNLIVKRAVEVNSLIHKLRQKKTNCNELDFGIEFDTLRLVLTDKNIGFFDLENRDYLAETMLGVADAGFDIIVDSSNQKIAERAIDAMETAMNKGYRKNLYALSCKDALDYEALKDTTFEDTITELSYPNDDEAAPVLQAIAEAETIEEAIDNLTIDAAISIGKEDELGSIETGKAADFVIFANNPFDCKDVAELGKLKAEMTILNGEIVYDSKNDNPDDWYKIIKGANDFEDEFDEIREDFDETWGISGAVL